MLGNEEVFKNSYCTGYGLWIEELCLTVKLMQFLDEKGSDLNSIVPLRKSRI